jgi:FAD/FMN-containing dehydrogenase
LEYLEFSEAIYVAYGRRTVEGVFDVFIGRKVFAKMVNIVEELQRLLPKNSIIVDDFEKAAFETDWRHLYSNKSICVVFPETTNEVASVVRLCSEAGIGVVPQGGNTGLVGGGVPASGPSQIILNLQRMKKIRALDLIGDTITVEAGVTLQALQDAAAAHNRLFPVSLAAEGSAQIGGVISTNAGGMQVLSYGSMRAMILGMEVVLADGRIWHGLRALRKDNTGLDLKQIFIGGEGIAGVITAAVLRLFPSISDRATALVGVTSVAAALDVFKLLQVNKGSGLTMCEFISRPALDLAVTHIPGGRIPFEAPAYLLVEFSAYTEKESINQELEDCLEKALTNDLATDGIIAKSEKERTELLQLREMISESELQEGGAVKHDVSVPIGRIPEVVQAIESMVAEHCPNFRLNIFGHLGDGNLHVNVRPPEGQTLDDIGAQKAAITEMVEALAVSYQGSFSAEHGIGQARIPGMLSHKSDVELDLMRRIKHALDPSGTLNPGKMLPAS